MNKKILPSLLLLCYYGYIIWHHYAVYSANSGIYNIVTFQNAVPLRTFVSTFLLSHNFRIYFSDLLDY